MKKLSPLYSFVIILICSLAMFILPFLLFKSANGETTFLFTIIPSGMSPENFKYFFYLHCLFILLITIAIIKYKSPRTQLLLASAAILLIVFFFTLLLALYYNAFRNATNVVLGIGFYVPIFEFLFLIVALLNLKRLK